MKEFCACGVDGRQHGLNNALPLWERLLPTGLWQRCNSSSNQHVHERERERSLIAMAVPDRCWAVVFKTVWEGTGVVPGQFCFVTVTKHPSARHLKNVPNV